MSVSLLKDSLAKDKDKWSWETISKEFHQKLDSAPCEKPKTIENPIIRTYLVKNCTGCIETPCLNCHKGQQLRREVKFLSATKWNYRPKKCQKINCHSYHCQFAHTKEEIFYHPIIYKTLPCNYSLINGICSRYKTLCPFVHAMTSENTDPLIENKKEIFGLATYKTVKCSKTETHDYKSCMFYHVLDRRRSPNEYEYSGEMCKSRENCANGDFCRDCHNSFEYLFHASNYKKSTCGYKICYYGELCPYTHNTQDHQVLPEQKNGLTIPELLEKSENLSQLLASQQAKNKRISKFICHFCFENKSQFVFPCGHLSCAGCIINSTCQACGKAFASKIEIKFIA